MKNGIQLITYANSLGSNLQELNEFLELYGKEAITGVHILPFFPSSADRGFAPMTYRSIDPEFGDWQTIGKIADKYDLVADFMVNHISKQSEYFKDYLKKGDESKWSNLFLPLEKLAENGEIKQEHIDLIYTRKPRAPWIDVTLADGTQKSVWCTFAEEQIDLDVNSRTGKQFIEEEIVALCKRGLAMLRLDAFAYVTKKMGTNCFFVEPDVWEILDRIRDIAANQGVEVLPEIHEHYTIQKKLSDHGYWVYDFALPMLVLHTLYSQNTKRLKDWLDICPRKQITTLDTHDGIGVVDVADLMTQEEIDETVETLYKKGSNLNRRYSSAEYDNLDIYQINCSYFSALSNNPEHYLLSRVIQFFAPGIPQVYYQGLLAGENDVEKVERTRHGRDINRHDYTLPEIGQEMKRPVVQKLFKIMAFRNQHPAFDGEFTLKKSDDNSLNIRWNNNDAFAELQMDLSNYSCIVSHSPVSNWESGSFNPLT